jgi:hypothetical protein
MSRKYIQMVLGNPRQRKDSATENHPRKRQYPECFVVNYVLPVIVPIFQVKDGHGLPPSKWVAILRKRKTSRDVPNRSWPHGSHIRDRLYFVAAVEVVGRILRCDRGSTPRQRNY